MNLSDEESGHFGSYKVEIEDGSSQLAANKGDDSSSSSLASEDNEPNNNKPDEQCLRLANRRPHLSEHQFQQAHFTRNRMQPEQKKEQPGDQRQQDELMKQVELFGVNIVALTINGKERLCLAQISNTLLKDFSYNEIHNRRVALGITCVQCTPIQLETLRRAGAMPSSSRRCGMITMREAERLCRSFLVEEQPPELPENFYFTVAHRINYGCKGRFVPARYISSRAKCIECFYCGEFYSPNKFIFHSHRQPHATDCNPPDSPNINSWRKHIDLDGAHEHSQDIKYAWEDVKSLFNGGTRRRPSGHQQHPVPLATGDHSSGDQQRKQLSGKRRDGEQLIDVELDEQPTAKEMGKQQTSCWPGGHRFGQASAASSRQANCSLMQTSPRCLGATKRLLQPASKQPASKRPLVAEQSSAGVQSVKQAVGGPFWPQQAADRLIGPNHHQVTQEGGVSPGASSQLFMRTQPRLAAQHTSPTSFIYSQLYTKLMQPQQSAPAQQPTAVEAQLALRHHLWSSLLANLQCNPTYSQPQQQQLNLAPQTEALDSPTTNLSHLISAQLYNQQQQQLVGKIPLLDGYKAAASQAQAAQTFSNMHKFPTGENGDL